ncbi:MAG: hypothetical protein K8I29_19695 [Alphaproteobacteria bacterium]|uniref:Uncharacterized protein n=1 Tax=Candidatus Nitrobium versatile TaxID=2884831 RepID=A0A953SI45_9BACT|nr:hypothetical protein [Candidatus Nitrobium versatile]
MPTVECNFLGTRRLKNGRSTGMLDIPENADRHALLDLEGKVYLTSVRPGEGDGKELADLYALLARIEQYLRDIREKFSPKPDEKAEEEPLFAGQGEPQEGKPDAR